MFNCDDHLLKNDFYNILEAISSRELCNNEHKKEQGVYLYIDKNCYWIMNNHCTCAYFVQRHNEHSKGAKLESENSRENLFYCSYPHDSVQVDGALSRLQKGKWSDLQIVTGVRWTKEQRENLMDLFTWDKSVLGGLNCNRTRGILLEKRRAYGSILV